MSSYKKKIEGIAEALSGLHVPTPEGIEQYYEVRAKGRQEQVLIEIEKIKQLNLSQEQLIADCAMLKVMVQFEQEKFAEYERRVELLLKPALNAAAPMADQLSDSQSKKGQIRGEQQSREKAEKDEVEVMRGRGNVSDIIVQLAHMTDELGGDLSPKDELWPELFSTLDNLGLRPIEVYDDSGKPLCINYRDGNGKNGHIMYSSFKSMVSTARKGKVK